ncbi:hypothetical protein ASG79_11905 [Arthrobacter sp. Soil761]|nr:hypothetical protein ASG79_11905 [Arthrobacter sp. Soil761]
MNYGESIPRVSIEMEPYFIASQEDICCSGGRPLDFNHKFTVLLADVQVVRLAAADILYNVAELLEMSSSFVYGPALNGPTLGGGQEKTLPSTILTRHVFNGSMPVRHFGSSIAGNEESIIFEAVQRLKPRRCLGKSLNEVLVLGKGADWIFCSHYTSKLIAVA